MDYLIIIQDTDPETPLPVELKDLDFSRTYQVNTYDCIDPDNLTVKSLMSVSSEESMLNCIAQAVKEMRRYLTVYTPHAGILQGLCSLAHLRGKCPKMDTPVSDLTNIVLGDVPMSLEQRRQFGLPFLHRWGFSPSRCLSATCHAIIRQHRG